MSFDFHSTDRLLVIAPHPDDESLAMGGLMQRISKAGVAARILMITNGDNNPWPQRWMEKRWRIGQPERRRWGMKRQQEARLALEKLGYQGEIYFLNLPDQGITAKLLHADQDVVERFCCEISQWKPTRIVMPSSHDLHSDHNAIHIFAQMALERTGYIGIPQYHFVVHCKHPELIPNREVLQLSEQERLIKRQAILCHETQMSLSSKRFLAFARPEEFYYHPTPVKTTKPYHPIFEARLESGALKLLVQLPLRLGRKSMLYVAGESSACGSLRWRIPLPGFSSEVAIDDTVNERPLEKKASVKITGRVARVSIPMPTATPVSRLFIKLQFRAIFLDEAGWREVPVT